MEQGGNVVEYLTPRKDRAKYIVGPISGGSVAVGDNTTQNTTINGTDADSLRTLMDAIAHVLPSLRMEMQDQKEAAEAADQIVTETGHRTPDRRNIHAALGRLRDLLARAGNQAFIAAVDYELAKLGLPPAR
jgi:hypothetical protein